MEEEEEIFGSMQVDNLPMYLVHTVELILRVPERKHNFLEYTKKV